MPGRGREVAQLRHEDGFGRCRTSKRRSRSARAAVLVPKLSDLDAHRRAAGPGLKRPRRSARKVWTCARRCYDLSASERTFDSRRDRGGGFEEPLALLGRLRPAGLAEAAQERLVRGFEEKRGRRVQAAPKRAGPRAFGELAQEACPSRMSRRRRRALDVRPLLLRGLDEPRETSAKASAAGLSSRSSRGLQNAFVAELIPDRSGP